MHLHKVLEQSFAWHFEGVGVVAPACTEFEAASLEVELVQFGRQAAYQIVQAY